MTACLACGSTDTSAWAEATDLEYFTTTERFTYRRCAACRALSIDPVPCDRLSPIYPANYYAYAGTGGGGLVVKIKEWLDQRTFGGLLARVRGERLAALDVGGGAGWLLTTLQALDSRVQDTHVVDLDPAAGDQALRLQKNVRHARRPERTNRIRKAGAPIRAASRPTGVSAGPSARLRRSTPRARPAPSTNTTPTTPPTP
jgi:hypothetical protein